MSEEGFTRLFLEDVSAGFPCPQTAGPELVSRHTAASQCLPLLVLKAHSDTTPRKPQSFKATQLVMGSVFLNSFPALHVRLPQLRMTLLNRSGKL